MVDRPGFEGREPERPLLAPHPLQCLRHAVLDAQLLIHAADGSRAGGRRPPALEPGGDAVIGELGAVHDYRSIDDGGVHGAGGGDSHVDDEAQALLSLGERAEIGGEPLGKHGEDFRRGVDARRVGARMLIERRADSHHRVDVRNRDKNLHPPAALRLRHRQLIEIARVVVVDRAPRQVAQVTDPGAARKRRGPDRAQLLEGRGGEIRLEAVLAHQAARDVLQLARPVFHAGMIPVRRRQALAGGSPKLEGTADFSAARSSLQALGKVPVKYAST